MCFGVLVSGVGAVFVGVFPAPAAVVLLHHEGIAAITRAHS